MFFVPDIFSRIGHMRGFGIQSPWAYSFVREVIAERWPYYAYTEIDEALEGAPKRVRKLVRLYFRIANRIQPDKLLDLTPTAGLVAPLIAKGCTKVLDSVHNEATPGETGEAKAEKIMLRLWLENIQNPTILKYAEQCADGSILIIEDINSSKEMRRRWKELLSDERLVVVFDLIDTAVVYIDRKMHKAVYKLNF